MGAQGHAFRSRDQAKFIQGESTTLMSPENLKEMGRVGGQGNTKEAGSEDKEQTL